MKKVKALVFETRRDGYSIDQVRKPMTVGKLKELLEDYDDEMLFVLSHDNGYTYSSIKEPMTFTGEEEEDEVWNWTEDEED